jgi:hypothetical protein
MKVCSDLEMESGQSAELHSLLGADSSYKVDFETFKKMLGLAPPVDREPSNRARSMRGAHHLVAVARPFTAAPNYTVYIYITMFIMYVCFIFSPSCIHAVRRNAFRHLFVSRTARQHF